MNTTEIKTKNRNKNKNKTLLDIVYISMFTALIAVCSQLSVPTPIPFTLQTFAVFMAGGILGWKRGTLSVFIYILLGIIGVPVFSNFSGGLGVLLGMTGGYIIGFIFTTLVIGFMCEKLKKKVWVLIVSMIIGMFIYYAFGTVWFMVVYGQQAEKIGIIVALSKCVFPYLIFDAAKIAAATVLVNRLDKIIKL